MPTFRHGSGLAWSVSQSSLPSFVPLRRSCRSAKISEEHREKFRFDKFVVVAPCDDAGGPAGAGSGSAMLSDFYFTRFDEEVLLQVRASDRGGACSWVRFVSHAGPIFCRFGQPGHVMYMETFAG